MSLRLALTAVRRVVERTGAVRAGGEGAEERGSSTCQPRGREDCKRDERESLEG